MTESANIEIFKKLQDTFKARGLEFSDDKVEVLAKYWEMVKHASQYQDLTRIIEDEAAYAKHFLDSYSPYLLANDYDYKLFGEGKYCLDIGTGAGFPGIPLSLLSKNKKWILVDSRLKKIEFLQRACKELKLENVLPLHARAEDLLRLMPECRSKVCLVTSRAIKLDEKIQKEAFKLMIRDGLLIQYAGPSAEVLEFPRGHSLEPILDLKPELHPETIHHRLLVYKK